MKYLSKLLLSSALVFGTTAFGMELPENTTDEILAANSQEAILQNVSSVNELKPSGDENQIEFSVLQKVMFDFKRLGFDFIKTLEGKINTVIKSNKENKFGLFPLSFAHDSSSLPVFINAVLQKDPVSAIAVSSLYSENDEHSFTALYNKIYKENKNVHYRNIISGVYLGHEDNGTLFVDKVERGESKRGHFMYLKYDEKSYNKLKQLNFLIRNSLYLSILNKYADRLQERDGFKDVKDTVLLKNNIISEYYIMFGEEKLEKFLIENQDLIPIPLNDLFGDYLNSQSFDPVITIAKTHDEILFNLISTVFSDNYKLQVYYINNNADLFFKDEILDKPKKSTINGNTYLGLDEIYKGEVTNNMRSTNKIFFDIISDYIINNGNIGWRKTSKKYFGPDVLQKELVIANKNASKDGGFGVVEKKDISALTKAIKSQSHSLQNLERLCVLAENILTALKSSQGFKNNPARSQYKDQQKVAEQNIVDIFYEIAPSIRLINALEDYIPSNAPLNLFDLAAGEEEKNDADELTILSNAVVETKEESKGDI